MPGMNGAEVARFAQNKYPSLPILFVISFMDRAALIGVKDSQIIAKPFVDDDLTTNIQLELSAGFRPVENGG